MSVGHVPHVSPRSAWEFPHWLTVAALVGESRFGVSKVTPKTIATIATIEIIAEFSNFLCFKVDSPLIPFSRIMYGFIFKGFVLI